MSDREPLLFRKEFGALRPVTGAAYDALATVKPGALVRLDLHNIRGNTRRLGLYWVVLKIAAEMLSDAVDGILSRQALHRWLKRENGLAKPIVSKKTGEVIDYDYDSISFAKMDEAGRAQHLEFTLELLSRRLGCDPETLRQETGLDDERRAA